MRKSRRSKSIAGYRRRAARRSGRAKLYSVSEWKSIARVHRHHFGRRPKKRSYRKNCGMCAGRNPGAKTNSNIWRYIFYLYAKERDGRLTSSEKKHLDFWKKELELK